MSDRPPDHQQALSDVTTPVETSWRLRGPTGRVMECCIHMHPQAGFSVQIRDGRTGVIRDCRVATLRRARKKAEDWRQALLSLSEYQACRPSAQ
jgi:hypothetical protein